MSSKNIYLFIYLSNNKYKCCHCRQCCKNHFLIPCQPQQNVELSLSFFILNVMTTFNSFETPQHDGGQQKENDVMISAGPQFSIHDRLLSCYKTILTEAPSLHQKQGIKMPPCWSRAPV